MQAITYQGTWQDRPLHLSQLDPQLSELIDRHAPAQASRLAVTVTELGSPRVAHALVLAGSALQARAQGRPVGPTVARSLAIVASGALLRHFLCHRIGRGRPPESRWRVKPDGASFPSKHTTMATLAASVLAHEMDGHRQEAALAAVALAGTVGISRVRLGVHWPSDVLAGWIFGLAWPPLVRSLVRFARRVG